MGQTAGNRAYTEMGDIGKGLPIYKRKQKLWSLPRGKNAHNAPDQQPHLPKQADGIGTEVQAQSQIPPQQLQVTHQTEGERGGRGGVQKLQPQKHQKIRKTKGVQEQEKRLRTTHYYVQKKKIGNQKNMTSQQRAAKQN